MEKASVDLSISYRLLNPGVVLLVSVGGPDRDNLFTVAWNTPVRRDPPMVGILSGKRHYSYLLMEQSGEFGLNVPEAGLRDAVLGCGTTTGSKEEDKFSRFGLSREPSEIIKPPLVREAVANLECRICQVVDLGPSAFLVAQVLRAQASPLHFRDGHWSFDSGLELLHHLSGDRFCVSDRAVVGRKA